MDIPKFYLNHTLFDKAFKYDSGVKLCEVMLDKLCLELLNNVEKEPG
jgi:hypothetical protein